ncbi:phospholipase D family protein, partial [Planktothrix sp.]
MIKIGEQLQNLCLNAQVEIIIAAPFIKASILKKLLDSIKSGLPIKCVTRWFPEEVLAGVTDLEVWLIIESYPNSSLWLRNDLHAKYYRADQQCLIGSANLTANALGWSHHS